jgi:hypothetical protein
MRRKAHDRLAHGVDAVVGGNPAIRAILARSFRWKKSMRSWF